MIHSRIAFPAFTGIRCLMMPFVQGDPDSVPDQYQPYANILRRVYFKRGDVGYLTIDESVAKGGRPHRGTRARHARALHTEVGVHPDRVYAWGGGWGRSHRVTLEEGVRVLLANSVDKSCALWDAEHRNTSIDGDIGYEADRYPYDEATMMKAGEVHDIGIFTPHESLPAQQDMPRQFLRIISSGVHGTEPHFTTNPLCGSAQVSV